MRVRDGVASALGKVGPAAKAIIPALTEILNDENEDKIVQKATRQSLVKIAEKLQDAEDSESIPDLEKALNAFVTRGFKEDAEKLNRSIHALKAIRRAKMWNSMKDWIYQNRWMFGPLIYLLLALSFSFSLVWLHPLWLLKINDALEPYTDFKLPDWLGGIKVPLRYILLVGFFNYHRRVLDAWVTQHIESVREAFQNRPTVRDRSVHVPVPVVFDGKSIADIAVEHLRSTFSSGRGVLLISGEGGAGKTSLACQMAKWAMSKDSTIRLFKDHLMLPVLIEYDLDSEEINRIDVFSEAIRGQLRSQIGGGYPLSKELVYHLLIQRRILVILDGLSELSEATRKVISPANPDFPVNTLIITSRIDEKLDGVPMTTIKPLRIQGNRLSTFIEAYLVQQGKRELFNDSEFFDACRRLSSIVGSREITPLLAKIYADQLILSKEGTTEQELPDNIPDLMLSYLNELNRGASADDPDDRTVHRAAKAITWECLKNTYRPTPARRPNILSALGENDDKPEVILSYLEDRLRLVQTIGSGRDQIKFALDPLAECLAGLYLVDHYNEKAEKWRDFFEHSGKLSGGPGPTKSFLLAVKDCCMAKGNETKLPNFVLGELDRRINLNEGSGHQILAP